MKHVTMEVQLRLLEEKLLEPAIRKSVADLEVLLADDFIEHGSSGRTFTKEMILERLPEEDKIEMELTGFQAKRLAENVYLTTFRVLRRNDMKYSIRSSIWKENKGQWQMVFHQGTPTNL